MTKRWFAVKSLYRTVCEGPPSFTDDAYDPNATLVEERVVLFQAESFEKAIELAEWEAKKYCRGEVVMTVYGQRKSITCLGDFNAYEMFESPGSGQEVFSRTEIVSSKEPDSAVSDRLLGTEDEPDVRRKKFADAEFGYPS